MERLCVLRAASVFVKVSLFGEGDAETGRSGGTATRGHGDAEKSEAGTRRKGEGANGSSWEFSLRRVSASMLGP